MILRWSQSIVRTVKRTAPHSPIDVANIKDLAIHAVHFRVASLKLDRDRCLSQIGGHWKVRDRGDQSDGSGDIVEDAMRTRLGEGQSDYS